MLLKAAMVCLSCGRDWTIFSVDPRPDAPCPFCGGASQVKS